MATFLKSSLITAFLSLFQNSVFFTYFFLTIYYITKNIENKRRRIDDIQQINNLVFVHNDKNTGFLPQKGRNHRKKGQKNRRLFFGKILLLQFFYLPLP
jgi:hypothetical protein